MDYLVAEQIGDDLIVRDIVHMDLAQTLDCGQAFRWSKTEWGYSGIVYARRLELFLEDNCLIVKNCTFEEFDTIWRQYFDLNRDYTVLKAELSVYENLKKAIDFSPGLRLLNQDPWETLISFILSQNTNIPRIKKMIESLCRIYGTPLPCGGYTFPTSEKLALLHPEDLAEIKCGYRSKYIIDAAIKVTNGTINIEALKNAPTEQIKNALLSICGVGPKVADCTLLYGFGKIECYPIDVWIKRITEKLFPKGFPTNLAEKAGIAQLFLFNYVRKGDIHDKGA